MSIGGHPTFDQHCWAALITELVFHGGKPHLPVISAGWFYFCNTEQVCISLLRMLSQVFFLPG